MVDPPRKPPQPAPLSQPPVKEVVTPTKDQQARTQQRPDAADGEGVFATLERFEALLRRPSDSLEVWLDAVLEACREIFTCDRAWLAHPCTLQAEGVGSVMLRTRPADFSGDDFHRALSQHPEFADLARRVRASVTPLIYSPPRPLPAPLAATAHPLAAHLLLTIGPSDSPWLLGLLRQEGRGAWSSLEQRLFGELGRRLGGMLEVRLTRQALQQSREQLAGLIAHLPCAVYRYGSSYGGTPLFLSDNVAEICGYPAADFLTARRSFSSLIDPVDLRRGQRQLQISITSRKAYVMEYRIRDSAGKIRWLAERGQPVFSASGALSHFDGVIFDITARRQAAEESTQLRQQLESIVNAMPSALIGIDVQQRVTLWNRDAERLTGILQRDALGQPVAELFNEFPGGYERLTKAIRERRVERLSRVNWNGHGVARLLDITLFPTNGRQVAGAVIRIDDVTERARLEGVVIQNEKMLSVGSLASGIAHEINNPLAGIMQNLQVMRQRLSPLLPKNRETAERCGTSMELINQYLGERGVYGIIDSAVQSGQRAADIVLNMLSFSRKEDNLYQVNDLKLILDQAVEIAASSFSIEKHFDFRKIRIRREYQIGLPQVPCNRGQLQQVFFNLLNNGAHAMAERLRFWELQIRAGRPQPVSEQACFVLRLYQRNQSVCCEIEDNGKGMDEATLRRVFEPFYTTKEQGQGTGLGLSLSYFIISENHKGRMSVRSQPEQGTCFLIELPLNP